MVIDGRENPGNERLMDAAAEEADIMTIPVSKKWDNPQGESPDQYRDVSSPLLALSPIPGISVPPPACTCGSPHLDRMGVSWLDRIMESQGEPLGDENSNAVSFGPLPE